jgi:DNA-binding Xre family transcriptional regulator
MATFDIITLIGNNCGMICNVKLSLEKILKDRDKTMYALAKEEQISYATIHKMTKGEIKSVDAEILMKICRNLNCTPNDVFGFGLKK